MKEIRSPKLRFREFSDNWNSCKLKDVASYTKGFAFKSQDYRSEGVRIVRVSDLGAETVKYENEHVYFDTKEAKEYAKY